MTHFLCLCLFVVSWVFCVIPSSYALQFSQTQVLLQMRVDLEFPKSLEIWGNYHNNDFCDLASMSSSQMSIKCEGNSVTELKIRGDKTTRSHDFNGFAIPNQTLSMNFSIGTFVTTLTRLTSLRVLSLVSLGMWGPLPDEIQRLSMLEVLDLSSNFLYGSVPMGISTLGNLSTLQLDGNYFNDTMPDWFGSLSNLTVLSLKMNALHGSFPKSLCTLENITDISLAQNELSGKLPDLSGLISLHMLNLKENRFHSELPWMPSGVVTILLRKNMFFGEIPRQFRELSQLQHLDLSENNLTGMPPAALFSLPNLSYLNLGNNMLRGSLHGHLSCGTKLGYVDISSNRLIGELPHCLANTSDKRVVKYDGNCLTLDPEHQQPGSHCEEYNSDRKASIASRKNKIVSWAIIVGLILVALGISVLGACFCIKCLRGKRTQDHLLSKTMQDNAATQFSSQLLTNASKYGS